MNLSSSSSGIALLNTTATAGLPNPIKDLAIVIGMMCTLALLVGGVCSAIMCARKQCRGVPYCCKKDAPPVFDSDRNRLRQDSIKIVDADDNDDAIQLEKQAAQRHDMYRIEQRVDAWDSTDTSLNS